ncbi:MAG: tetratricopeptide repeat protein [Prevotella sp.]|nr:tetratricopeptide repeat protein [Prevotella sp.]
MNPFKPYCHFMIAALAALLLTASTVSCKKQSTLPVKSEAKEEIKGIELYNEASRLLFPMPLDDNATIHADSVRKAIQLLEKFLPNVDSYHLAFSQLAQAKASIHDYEGALKVLDDAYKKFPDYASFLMQRGATLEQMGRYDEALQAYRQAITVYDRAASGNSERADPINRAMAIGLCEGTEALRAELEAIVNDPSINEEVRQVAAYSLDEYPLYNDAQLHQVIQQAAVIFARVYDPER